MKILQSQTYDIPDIFIFYDLAIEHQKTIFKKEWRPYDEFLIRKEISEKRQWKIMEGDRLACIFAISFDDPYLWGEKSSDPAIYIHRIVTSPIFEGGNYVKKIVTWAKERALEENLLFIRMDTWGNDKVLSNYYEACGFNFIGTVTPGNVNELPRPHRTILLSLYEIRVTIPAPGNILNN